MPGGDRHRAAGRRSRGRGSRPQHARARPRGPGRLRARRRRARGVARHRHRGGQHRRHRPRARQPQRGAQLLRPRRACGDGDRRGDRGGRPVRDRDLVRGVHPPQRDPRQLRPWPVGPRRLPRGRERRHPARGHRHGRPVPDQPLGAAAGRVGRRRGRAGAARPARRAARRRAVRGAVQRQPLRGEGRARALAGPTGGRARGRGGGARATRRPAAGAGTTPGCCGSPHGPRPTPPRWPVPAATVPPPSSRCSAARRCGPSAIDSSPRPSSWSTGDRPT